MATGLLALGDLANNAHNTNNQRAMAQRRMPQPMPSQGMQITPQPTMGINLPDQNQSAPPSFSSPSPQMGIQLPDQQNQQMAGRPMPMPTGAMALGRPQAQSQMAMPRPMPDQSQMIMGRPRPQPSPQAVAASRALNNFIPRS